MYIGFVNYEFLHCVFNELYVLILIATDVAMHGTNKQFLNLNLNTEYFVLVTKNRKEQHTEKKYKKRLENLISAVTVIKNSSDHIASILFRIFHI